MMRGFYARVLPMVALEAVADPVQLFAHATVETED